MDPILDQDTQEFGLTVGSKAQDYLYEAGRWGKFLSIVGFVIIGLMVLGGLGMTLFMGSAASTLESSEYGSPGLGLLGGGFFAVIYIIVAALYFFPTLYLYRFSTNAMAAVDQGTQINMDDSFANLKSMLKFMGILTIVVMSFYALGILFTLVVGVSAL